LKTLLGANQIGYHPDKAVELCRIVQIAFVTW